MVFLQVFVKKLMFLDRKSPLTMRTVWRIRRISRTSTRLRVILQEQIKNRKQNRWGNRWSSLFPPNQRLPFIPTSGLSVPLLAASGHQRYRLTRPQRVVGHHRCPPIRRTTIIPRTPPQEEFQAPSAPHQGPQTQPDRQPLGDPLILVIPRQLQPRQLRDVL